jgi:hypothetical protein
VEWWFLRRQWPGKRAVERRFHVCAAFRSGISARFFRGRTTALKQIETMREKSGLVRGAVFSLSPVEISRK